MNMNENPENKELFQTDENLEIYTQKLRSLYYVTGFPLAIVNDLNYFKLLFPFTEHEPDFHGHAIFLQDLIQKHKVPLYTPLICSIRSSSYYCILRVTETIFVQMGPVASHEINFAKYITYIPQKYSAEARAFHLQLLRGAPKVDLNYFLNTAILLTNLLCNRDIDTDHMILNLDTHSDHIISSDNFFEHSTISLEQLSFYNEIYQLIELGDINKLQEIKNINHLASLTYFQENDIHFLRLAFMFYGGIICHHAVIGGLKSIEVKQIFDSYLSQIDKASNPETLRNLLPDLAYTYCNKIHELKYKNTSSELVQSCVKYIQSNLLSTITLEDLETVVHCSRRTILRHFKEYLNTTPSQYIADEKLKSACELLTNSNISIVEISAIFNYSSQSHFSKQFYKKYGYTPLSYRSQFKTFKNDELT